MSGRCRLVVLVALLAVAPALAAPAAPAPEPLLVDLSSHVVAVTSGFTGASLLLFGAVEGEGDVVVVVRGPVQTELLRRRERLLGLWINRAQAAVADAPAYYRVASTRPLAAIASAAVLDRHEIGVDHLAMRVRRRDKAVADADYRQALLRLKERAGLYATASAPVNMLGGRLFRTEMDFPANVPTGIYTVEVYLMKDGKVASAQTTPLIISKTGISAEIFDFADRHAALYGVAAVSLAMAAGWLAAAAFRRV